MSITKEENVAAGAFTAPVESVGRAGGQEPNFSDLPPFCRVQATLNPSLDSDIKIEVWMPAEASWNGKFLGLGNGGLGGGAGVSPGGLASALRLGYATAGNNTGHAGDSRYALDHPEKVKDFGYRSVHEMTLTAKRLMTEYYGRGPKLSYVSAGGGAAIAGLSSAQRYPRDYDGISVTGMASYFTRQTFGQMWIWQATHKDQASFIPPEKYTVLHKAALESCDAMDGLKDGLIADPEHCTFDPAVTLCAGADLPGCLTAPQVEAAKKIYAGPHNPRTGAEIYSPMYPGSELGWGPLAGGNEPFPVPIEFFKYFVFRDPKWDYRIRPVNFDSDLDLADKPENAPMDSVAPDLNGFFSRGGKFLLIGGWNDNLIPPKYRSTITTPCWLGWGRRKHKSLCGFSWFRELQHGPGTAGPENFDFDAHGLLVAWKEEGKAPEQLIVRHYKNGMEIGRRLVCQYPQAAMCRDSGNVEDPSSFSCR